MALKDHPAAPAPEFRRSPWLPRLQAAYAALFAGLFLLPNLLHAPSLVMVAAAVLAVVWMVGTLAEWRGFSRADEMMLCGSFAPVILAIWTTGARLAFIYSHQALTDPRIPSVTASGFIVAWVFEILLVLLPGIAFFGINIRALRPVPPGDQFIASKRPSSRKRRT